MRLRLKPVRTGKLGTILENIGEGLYSLKADPKRMIREKDPPQYW